MRLGPIRASTSSGRRSRKSRSVAPYIHGETDPDETERLEKQARFLTRWILDDGVPARLQIQLHKYLWPGVERGV